jgi:hypothetical protein
MQKSLIDKIWFISHIDDDVYNFVDYGCADGSLMKMLYKINPNYNYYGFDICENMLEIANENFSSCTYHHNWSSLKDDYSKSDHDGILNISSLIHEVYSYGNKSSINEFWNNVFNSINFKYISIRDMAINQKAQHIAYAEDVAKVYHCADQDMLNDFEAQWGSIEYLPNLIHWLLKYRYKTNWQREVRENYLPITIEDLYRKINFDKYKMVYQEHYTLPFLKEVVSKDFDIELKENTHVKILLQRKDTI